MAAFFQLSRSLAGAEAGLVAYWRCNEGVGAAIADATTNRLDGTLYGPAWVGSPVLLINSVGPFLGALDFGASRESCIEVPTPPSLTLSNRLTFEAWVKPRTTRCSTILSRGDGGNLAATEYLFQVGADGTNCGVMKVALMVAGQWAASASEVRVWNRVRSAEEISADAGGTSSSPAPGLVGYWRFNESAGILKAIDASGQGNHGTLVNRPLRVGFQFLADVNPGGLFQFALTNAGGWNFTVLMSTNLADWEPLPAPAWPVWQFFDPAATSQPPRFYRLRWP